MSLESNRSLGGVGAILVAIGSFFPPLSLIGIILVLVAMKGLAEYYDDNGIFENALYGFIFGIIGIIAFIVVFFLGIIGGVLLAIPALVFFPALIGLIVGLVVMFVFFLLHAVYYRRAFTILSLKSGEKMFDTAGLLLLIGAILTIILIGVIVLLIAWILAAVGFFSIKTLAAPPPPLAPPEAPTVPEEQIYCRYCGTPNKSDAIFCKKCGKNIAEE